MMTYIPHPIATDDIQLPDELLPVMEMLAKNTHENWAQSRMDQGWVYGPVRNDEKKQHPCLVPYEMLPEKEKEYDRITATQTLKTILSLGFRIAR